MGLPSSCDRALRALTVSAVSLGVVSGAAAETAAPQGTFAFLPPEIPQSDICTQARTPQEIIALWQGWQGPSLPHADFQEIRRDLRRLAFEDATGWFDTILAVYKALLEADPWYDDDDLRLDLIKLYIDAGRTSELAQLNYVIDALDAIGDGSAQDKREMAEYLTAGIGIRPDPERGLALLVEAGFGGDPEALLALSAATRRGEDVAGWDIPSDLAATMALGGIIGQLDPGICARARRIAREFEGGILVQPSPEAEVAWYRFAAGLGDTRSAWAAATLYLNAENIRRDSAEMVRLMTQAADAGHPSAATELGTLYMRGSFIDRDATKAEYYLRAAFASGSALAQLRLVQLLKEEKATQPHLKPRYLEELRILVQTDQAPAWSYRELAEVVMEERGPWSEMDTVVPLLRQAASAGDRRAAPMLARSLMMMDFSRDSFDEAVDVLTQAVSVGGSIAAMEALIDLHLCRNPIGADLQMADYWRNIYNAAGTEANATATRIEITRQVPGDMGQHLVALARWPDAYEFAFDAVQSETSFDDLWPVLVADHPRAALGLARAALERAVKGADRDLAFSLLKDLALAGDADAAVDYIRGRLDHGARPDALRLDDLFDGVRQAAAAGHADAVRLVIEVSDDGTALSESMSEAYLPVLSQSDDGDALLLAATLLPVEERAGLLRRARAVLNCDFPSAIEMARSTAALGDAAATDEWFAIAQFLSEDVGWRYARLGDVLLELGGPTHRESAIAFYRYGSGLGDNTSALRLLDVYWDPQSPDSDTDGAADLFLEILERADTPGKLALLRKLNGATEAIRSIVEPQVDVLATYRVAASEGYPTAMREYSLRLRSSASDPNELREALRWLEEAALAGDVPAMVEFASAMAFGLGLEPDPSAARHWLERAAEAGDGRAADMTRLIGIGDIH